MQIQLEVIRGASISSAKKVSKEALMRLGTTLQSYLVYLGGKEKVPEHLNIEEFGKRSMESCKDCSGRTNSGNFHVTNLKNNKTISLPYIAVHTMAEHGKAFYQGSFYQGTVDIDELKKVLG